VLEPAHTILSDVFIILFLLLVCSFSCLVVNLISPSFPIALSSRKQAAAVYGGAVLVLSVLLAATALYALRPSPPAKAAPTQPSDRDAIETTVKEQLAGKRYIGHDNAVDKLRRVDVVKQSNGGYTVSIEYNADDNISNDHIREGIWIQSSRLYSVLYAGRGVQNASIAAYFPLREKDGSTRDQLVYETQLSKDQADKVDWTGDPDDLWHKVVPGVWHVTQDRLIN
jgi:hypothetical protein